MSELSACSHCLGGIWRLPFPIAEHRNLQIWAVVFEGYVQEIVHAMKAPKAFVAHFSSFHFPFH